MISNQTVFLTEDRKSAVKEGDPKAKFLLVREGHEIADALIEQYDGAAKLIGSKPSGKAEAPAAPLPSAEGSPAPTNREDAMPKRRTRKK